VNGGGGSHSSTNLRRWVRAYIAFALSPRGQPIIGAGSFGDLLLGAGELERERAGLG
jgi:hypothetical protein